METIGRNMDKGTADIRDYFLSAENAYLEELLKNKDNVKRIQEYMNMPLKTIFEVTKSIINAMEIGALKKRDGEIKIIDEETSARLEKQLILLMASIDDVQMAKILELTKDENGLEL